MNDKDIFRNMTDYISINHDVMNDTMNKCNTVPDLQSAIEVSKSKQFMVKHEDDISQPQKSDASTKYVVSNKRSFEAAKGYPGKRVAVLNFANNHSVGGAPYSAGAQEESLCRCSTLYPCLLAMRNQFHDVHQQLFNQHLLDKMGNDDLIYTPDVVVFKTDERTTVIRPIMMSPEKWYKVNVITCAAPEFHRGNQSYPSNYEEIIKSRCKKILDVAARQGDEVLILGAWGCGAYGNNSVVVAKAFHELLKNYDFEVVEFALSSGDNLDNSPFVLELKNESSFKKNIAPKTVDPNSTSKSSALPKEEPTVNTENENGVVANLYNRPYSGNVKAPIKPNEVFVFNSYSNGINKAGTAKAAVTYFGAQQGVGNGPTGQCYAIPSEISLDKMQDAVNTFAEYAKDHAELRFLVTPIGVGQVFKREAMEMARLFKCCLPIENVLLPQQFVEILKEDASACADDVPMEEEVTAPDANEQVVDDEPYDESIDYAAIMAEMECKEIRPHNYPYFSSSRITSLHVGEIFVFGSNLSGSHGAGAAKMAYDKFGAEWGVGVGPTGQCYAIPTMQGGVNAIKPYVDDFIDYAKEHIDNTFLVTRIGCSIAGFQDSDIAPLFEKAMNLPNVRLPRSFAVINIMLENMRSGVADLLEVHESYQYEEFKGENIEPIISTDHDFSFSLIKKGDKYGLFEHIVESRCGGTKSYLSVGEPFVYDEVKFCKLEYSGTLDCGYRGYIALKRNESWAILSLDCDLRYQLMSVCNTFDEAWKKLIILTGTDTTYWYDPFIKKAEREKN